MTAQILTQEYLNSIFHYNNGELFWKKRLSIRVFVGKKVGFLDKTGYTYTRIKTKIYGIHRIIYAMHNGYMPFIVDHVDKNPLNNCIENLRPATKSQNAMNSKIQKNNKSGVKGVCWHKHAKKWHARIVVKGKCKSIGLFKNLIDAELAVQKIRKKMHMEFASNG